MTLRNALTIDVEDYFQVSGFERDIRREDWGTYSSRVVQNTRRILSLFDSRGIRATFFVLGWVADRYPGLVREIDEAGHEVGSHSYWHRLVYSLSPSEFREDLRRSRDVLQRITSGPITSYRAPSFSITSQSLWALDILADEGFKIDASVFPIRHHRYGIPEAPFHPYVHEATSGRLWEFPSSVSRIAKKNLPISGGGYFRLLPYRLTSRLLRRINNQLNQPFMFYIHPWELDPEQPRMRAGTHGARFCHYVNLKTTEAKLERLLSQFSFDRVDRVLDSYFFAGQRMSGESTIKDDLRSDRAQVEILTASARR
jgi:polysaccharide deacetylase family protein (PEP-CTERM system associated)